MELLTLNDGVNITVNSDGDFREIIRDRLGNDAADYYENRIGEVEELFDDVIRIIEAYPDSTVSHNISRLFEESGEVMRWNE